MAIHRRQREPRAHWILVSLLFLTLCGALLIQGYAAGTFTSEMPAPATGGRSPVAGAAPVLNLSQDKPSSLAMPAKTVALTFDDGPDPRWTPQILDLLRRHNAHATFFVIGSRAAEHPGLLRRMVAEGHAVGVHTYTHVGLGTASAPRRTLELALSQKVLAGAIGSHSRLLRPPYSSEPDALAGKEFEAASDAARDGYLIVLSDHDSKDWAGRTTSQIVRASTPRADRGAVVLLHDGGGDRAPTVAAVDRLLTSLSAKGYRFATVPAGVGLSGTSEPVGLVERASGKATLLIQQVANHTSQLLLIALTVAAALTLFRLLLVLVLARWHAFRAPRRPRLPYFPPISVVVPAYNERAGIASTVQSLVYTDYPGHVQVIVVDDGSTDDTAAIVASLRLPNVQLIRQDNAGKAAALQTGLAYARHEVVVMLDGDTVFEPSTLGQLVKPFADPRVGAVSGNTKVANGRGLLGRWQHIEYVIGFNLDRRMFDVLQCMPTVPGAIGAFRMSALRSVGGLSSDTLAEDTDLTMALARAGWRVVYEETARAWTEVPGSLRQLWRQRYRWCYGTLQAMWKHRRSVFARARSGGRLGRRGLTYLTLFQVLLPLLAPAVDLFAVYGLLFGSAGYVLAVWAGFALLQLFAGAVALRLDREPMRAVWWLPLQQLVYRQLLYLVTIQSVVTAIVGTPLRWHKIRRLGAAQRAGQAPPLRPVAQAPARPQAVRRR